MVDKRMGPGRIEAESGTSIYRYTRQNSCGGVAARRNSCCAVAQPLPLPDTPILTRVVWYGILHPYEGTWN